MNSQTGGFERSQRDRLSVDWLHEGLDHLARLEANSRVARLRYAAEKTAETKRQFEQDQQAIAQQRDYLARFPLEVVFDLLGRLQLWHDDAAFRLLKDPENERARVSYTASARKLERQKEYLMGRPLKEQIQYLHYKKRELEMAARAMRADSSQANQRHYMVLQQAVLEQQERVFQYPLEAHLDYLEHLEIESALADIRRQRIDSEEAKAGYDRTIAREMEARPLLLLVSPEEYVACLNREMERLTHALSQLRQEPSDKNERAILYLCDRFMSRWNRLLVLVKERDELDLVPYYQLLAQFDALLDRYRVLFAEVPFPDLTTYSQSMSSMSTKHAFGQTILEENRDLTGGSWLHAESINLALSMLSYNEFPSPTYMFEQIPSFPVADQDVNQGSPTPEDIPVSLQEDLFNNIRKDLLKRGVVPPQSPVNSGTGTKPQPDFPPVDQAPRPRLLTDSDD